MNYRITLTGAQTYTCRALPKFKMNKGESAIVSEELKNQICADMYVNALQEKVPYFTAVPCEPIQSAKQSVALSDIEADTDFSEVADEELDDSGEEEVGEVTDTAPAKPAAPRRAKKA